MLSVFIAGLIFGQGLALDLLCEVADGAAHHIEFPEPAYEVSPDHNPEFAASTYRFRYQSLVTPPSVFDYDVAGRRSALTIGRSASSAAAIGSSAIRAASGSCGRRRSSSPAVSPASSSCRRRRRSGSCSGAGRRR
jgi:hypothetical protein